MYFVQLVLEWFVCISLLQAVLSHGGRRGGGGRGGGGQRAFGGGGMFGRLGGGGGGGRMGGGGGGRLGGGGGGRPGGSRPTPAPPITTPRVDQVITGSFQVTQGEPLGLLLPSTVALVRTPQTTLISDSGYAYDKQKLLDGLQSLGVSLAEIDFATISHGHPDHQGNSNLFIDGTIHANAGVFLKYNTLCFNPMSGAPPGTALQLDDYITIMNSGGGDTIEAMSTIVESAEVYNEQQELVYSGIVGYSGDLILTEGDFSANEGFSVATAEDAALKLQSLAYLLCPNGANVGYVLPGHGAGFQVTDEMRNSVNCGGLSYQPQRVTISPSLDENRNVFSCDMITYA